MTSGWVIVGPDGYVFWGTFKLDRAAVVFDAGAVCILNKLKANQLLIAPAQLLVDTAGAEVYNEDPDYVEKLKAANLAAGKGRHGRSRKRKDPRAAGDRKAD